MPVSVYGLCLKINNHIMYAHITKKGLTNPKVCQSFMNYLIEFMVIGVTGFEPATS